MSFLNVRGNNLSSLPLEVPVIYVMYVFSLLLLVSAGAQAQGAFHAADSVVMRDTLIESSMTIEHKPLRAGVELHYGWGDYYDANVPALVTGSDCNFYSTANGNDYGVRLLADIPFWGDYSEWTFQPSLFLQFHHPDFNWVEGDSSYDALSNALVPFSIRHEIAATVGEAGIGGGFSYELAKRWHATGGVNVGLLFQQSFQTSWHRVEPGLLTLYSRDTTILSGSLSNKLAISPSISFGLSYEVPLSTKLWAQPGINVSVPLGGQANDGSLQWRFGGMSYWRAVEVNATLALMFDLTPRMERVPIFVKQQVPVVILATPKEQKSPKLTASIRAVAISSTGERSDVVRMTVEEVRTRNADPILNYIFFDAGSSAFPERYVTYATPEQAVQEFQGSSERQNIKLMDLYRETLNILGDRLRKYPKTRVTLIGSTDNADDRTAGGNSDASLVALARKRAEAVRKYLIEIWKVDPARLKVEAALLPAKPSPSSTEDGRAENRRVEFRIVGDAGVEGDDSTSLRVTAPVTVTNIEHLATPDSIHLIPSVTAPIIRSSASISAQGIVLQSFGSNNSNGSEEKEWAPTEETLNKLRDSLDIDYDVTDSIGNHAHAHSSIPLDIVHVTSDRPERIERFSLILFGFDESQLGSGNERSVVSAADMINRIPVKRVLIQGFTDEMGDPTHNDVLSKTRADNVRTELEGVLRTERVDPAGLDIHSQGRGSHDLPYDNRLPEGRFFSRTVNITIERGQ